MNTNDWKKTKKIYWKDEFNQDFNELGLTRKGVPSNYKYKHTSPIYWFFSHILYYGLAKLVLGPYCILHGIKFKNKKVLKAFKHTGAFIYANHVAISDAFKFQIFIHRRVHIIGYSDALSIPVAKRIVPSLGLIPLPLKEDRDNFHKMTDYINYLVNKRKYYVLIFPEAHIWPYYTEIRNWKNNALIYPAMMNVPIIPAVTVWKKRKFRKVPRQVVVFGTPIYPKEGESITFNKDYLHQQCLGQMKSISRSFIQQKYVEYIKVED